MSLPAQSSGDLAEQSQEGHGLCIKMLHWTLQLLSINKRVLFKLMQEQISDMQNFSPQRTDPPKVLLNLSDQEISLDIE